MILILLKEKPPISIDQIVVEHTGKLFVLGRGSFVFWGHVQLQNYEDFSPALMNKCIELSNYVSGKFIKAHFNYKDVGTVDAMLLITIVIFIVIFLTVIEIIT